LAVLWREASFRQEVWGGALAVAALIGMGATAASIATFVMLWLVLLSVEALNTALEAIVDHLSPEWSAFGKQVKDLGSAAVFLMLLANGVFFGMTIVALVLPSA
ncbi:MAG: diacylglycerol kinase, partial [Rhodobacterales bacterium]